jgi:hypothetical protein
MKKALISAFLCFGVLVNVNADQATRDGFNSDLRDADYNGILRIEKEIRSSRTLFPNERAELLGKVEARKTSESKEVDIQSEWFEDALKIAVADVVKKGDYFRWNDLLERYELNSDSEPEGYKERHPHKEFVWYREMVKAAALENGIKFRR